MYALTSDKGNSWTASVPNVWGQVVEAQVRDAGRLQRAIVASAQCGVVEKAARRVREHELVFPREHLAARERIQDAGDLVDERHGAGAAGLRDVLAGEAVGAAHMHDAPLEVDVAPAQRTQLAEAQAGVGRG